VSSREKRWKNKSGEWKEESRKERRRGEEKYISTVIFFSFFCKREKDWIFERERNDFQIFFTLFESGCRCLQWIYMDLDGFMHLNDKKYDISWTYH
jgi:hypothetical protein